MKRLLTNAATVAAVVLPSVILSELAGVDPVWYLMGLWLWKDLSEAPRTGPEDYCSRGERRETGGR